MKLLQFRLFNDLSGTIRIGYLLGNEVYEWNTELTMRALIVSMQNEPLRENILPVRATHVLEEVELLAPVHDPEKFLFIGLNYHDHVIESGMELPKVPVLFAKFNNSIVADRSEITIPESVTQCDYEVELAVVIGKQASHVNEEDAWDYVLGYTIVNDVSARDIQLSEGQWTRGKAIDGFGPMGPWIVTKESLADPHALSLSLRLNGRVMQDSRTEELIFKIPFLVHFLSQTMTLSPGDIICTGTPPGVGMGRDPQVWLQDGDVTEATVEGIGTLTNRFRSHPLKR